MPYIKQEDRVKFKDSINEIVYLIESTGKTHYSGKLFGFTVCQIIAKYTKGQCSLDFDMPEESLQKIAIKIAQSIDKIDFSFVEDLLVSSGQINYFISSIYWGISGEKEDIASANYAKRLFLRGYLHLCLEGLSLYKHNEYLYAVLSALLNDIIDECCRKVTSVYEDSKEAENGKVWNNGQLS